MSARSHHHKFFIEVVFHMTIHVKVHASFHVTFHVKFLVTVHVTFHSGLFLLSDQATWLAAIVPIGALLNNVPSVTIANRRGIRGLFTVLGFISTLATILLPTAIKVRPKLL